VISNIQATIEKQREHYAKQGKPLLTRMCEAHKLTIRDFAAVFGISKAHAEKIMKQQALPSLELAFRIARYWETKVDELFGWRIDDTGERRPLIVELPGEGTARLSYHKPHRDALELTEEIAKAKGDPVKMKALAKRMKERTR
jgi:transcriptional regulator with XRE-family HTH domain